MLKCELSMLQTGGSAPLPGRGLFAHSRSRPCVLPVRIFDSVCELVVPPAGSLRRPGRFAPGPQTGRVPVPTAAKPPCNFGPMIDRSREPLLKCELSMLQTGGGAPLPGRGLSAHSRNRPCVLPVRIFDSVCSWSFRPQATSGGRGASPPDPRPAGCRCRRRLRRLEFYFIISAVSFCVVPPADCFRLRRSRFLRPHVGDIGCAAHDHRQAVQPHCAA